MTSYFAKRVIAGITSLLAVSFCIFFLIHLLPGNPAYAVLGGRQGVPTADQVAIVTEKLGLDRPIPVQYGRWLWRVLHLDLGESYIQNVSLSQEIPKRLSRTMELVLPALIIGTSMGILLGVFSATRRGRVPDFVLTVLSLVGYSIPVFVVGAGFVVVFALQLKLVPTSGYVRLSTGLGPFLRAHILPVVALSLAPMATTLRMTRSCTLETLGSDYIRTARAKGVREGVVVAKHAFRSALPPIVTMIGLLAGRMIGGSIIVESLFNWPGLGVYTLQAVGTHDYPVIQAVALVVAVFFVSVNVLVDLGCGWLDPRIAYE